MARGTRVLRLVREAPVRSQGEMSPSSKVLRAAEGSPDDNVALLDLIVARVRGETGTPEKDISVEHGEGSRFVVTAPGDFLEHLSEQREVAMGDESGRDPFGL
jgi:hypothetical protein